MSELYQGFLHQELGKILGFPFEHTTPFKRAFSEEELEILIQSVTFQRDSDRLGAHPVTSRLISRNLLVLKDGNISLAEPHDFIGNFILFYRDAIHDKEVPAFDGYFTQDVSDHTIISYELTRELVNSAPGIWVIDCVCRKLHGNCDHPLDVCMGLTEEYDLEGARKLGIDEAMDLIDSVEQRNLVASYMKSSSGFDWLCYCCGCCCIALNQYMKDAKGAQPNEFLAFTDNDLCTVCGECVDACQLSARRIIDDELLFEAALCLGCGVCLDDCSSEAISLINR